MVAVRQQPAPLKNTSGGGNPGSSVTIHETANTSNGAGAAAHANLQSRGNVRNASWHYQVDEKEVVQSFQHQIRCWHAGTRDGNNTSIAIEICVNADGNFAGAVENAAALAAQILAQKGLGIGSLKQHNAWSGKNCPNNLRSGAKGITWDQFVAKVNAHLGGTPKPPDPPAGEVPLVIDGDRGPKTITKWQKVMNTPPDGVISKPVSSLIKADQTFLNSVVPPEHQKNLHGGNSLVVDGDEGKKTVIVRQFWLHNAVAQQHQINLIGHLLAFDGILGPETNKVHQFALNNAVNGSKNYGRVA